MGQEREPIDPEKLAALPAHERNLFSLHLQREMDVQMERTLAKTVLDYLISTKAAQESQRSLIQLEVVPTSVATCYLINYVLPKQDQEQSLLCTWQEVQEDWEVHPLPGGEVDSVVKHLLLGGVIRKPPSV
jgi:hypothetical protein